MSELERELAGLGGAIAWPEPRRDLPTAVGARLHSRPPLRSRRLLLAAAAFVAAVGALFAQPDARSAILELFQLGGVSVERGTPSPELSAAQAAPGNRVTLADARKAAGFPLSIPAGYDAVYLEGSGTSALVTFVWPDRLLSQFRGESLTVTKLAPSGTSVEQLTIDGSRALWIEGAPHGVTLPGGETRLAGNVLIWTRHGTTFRLEGAISRAQAIQLAKRTGRPQ